jgi:hypothetical protein
MFDFFRGKEQRRIEDLLKESKTNVDREYGPISKIGVEIFRAANGSKDRTKYLIQIHDEKERLEREIYLYFEALYFFTFFGTMHVSLFLSDSQAGKTLDYLSSVIPPAAIDSYFAHWPDELKRRMTKEFVDKLTAQYKEYSALLVKESSDDERFAGLFGLFSENIIRLCEREAEWENLGPVVFEIVFDEARKSRFDLLVAQMEK